MSFYAWMSVIAGVAVQCDIRALRHALAELLANVLSFSPDGSEVVLTQWVEANTVWLELVDHGPGMSPDLLEEALKDFQQIDRERQEQQGIGLGLVIAQRMVKLYGGMFRIESEPHAQTIITFDLPLAGDQAE